MRIGAQFYTLRNQCRTLPEFAESLKKVADIGYEYVQISACCDCEADWLKAELDKNGLVCVLTHTAPQKILEATRETAAYHKTIGCGLVGLGSARFDGATEKDTLEYFLAHYPKAAETLREEGLYFMYHNHAREFAKQGGRRVIEILAEEVPADLMGFTLDTFWVQEGGGDPSFWLEELKGRVPAIHLKDCRYENGWDDLPYRKAVSEAMAPVGEGNLDFPRILKAAEEAGTEYLLVEQDDCHGEDPFDCLKRSYDYLRSLGLR